MEKTTYEVSVACTNCDFQGKMEITKGIEVTIRKCPNCGCHRLRKLDRPRMEPA